MLILQCATLLIIVCWTHFWLLMSMLVTVLQETGPVWGCQHPCPSQQDPCRAATFALLCTSGLIWKHRMEGFMSYYPEAVYSRLTQDFVKKESNRWQFSSAPSDSLNHVG